MILKAECDMWDTPGRAVISQCSKPCIGPDGICEHLRAYRRPVGKEEL